MKKSLKVAVMAELRIVEQAIRMGVTDGAIFHIDNALSMLQCKEDKK